MQSTLMVRIEKIICVNPSNPCHQCAISKYELKNRIDLSL